MRRCRRRALLPFWGPSARAAAPGAGGRPGGRAGAGSEGCAFLRAALGGGSKLASPVAQEHLLGAKRPRVWPAGSRPPCPRPSHASDTSGCLLRWELRGGLTSEELGTAPRFPLGSRVPRERQLRAWAPSGGRELSLSCPDLGDPQFCGGAPRPLRRCLTRSCGESSEQEALGRHYFAGAVETRLLQLPGSQVEKE